MNILLSAVTGIAGTLVMTAFTNVAALIMKKPFNVIRILTFMIDFKPIDAIKHIKAANYLNASLIHYGIGAAFGLATGWLLFEEILMLSLSHAVLFGSCLGVIAVIGWRLFFAIHPSPPKLNLNLYLLMIFVGHIILSLTMFIIYSQFNVTALASSDIPVC